ncbi:hypothetical protein OG539_32535 [Actinacidiphila glaucinigra]|uniref:hypothetical protein n=1 Tax=Actinacidiphila glaucinigra TaxID=235986 RepID=UPI0032561D7E
MVASVTPGEQRPTDEIPTGRELTAREFLAGLDPNAKPYIPEVDGDDEPLSPERRTEILRLLLSEHRTVAELDVVAGELLDELDRVQRAYIFDTAELKRQSDDARTAAVTEAMEAAKGEYLQDNTGDAEDLAYDRAIAHVIVALRRLLPEGAPDLAAENARLKAELAKYVGQEPTLAEEALYAHGDKVLREAADQVDAKADALDKTLGTRTETASIQRGVAADLRRIADEGGHR